MHFHCPILPQLLHQQFQRYSSVMELQLELALELELELALALALAVVSGWSAGLARVSGPAWAAGVAERVGRFRLGLDMRKVLGDGVVGWVGAVA